MKNAYTLTEVVIVVSIIATIAGLSFPVFRTNLIQSQFNNSAKKIINFIEAQRVLVQKQDKLCKLEYIDAEKKIVLSSSSENLSELEIKNFDLSLNSSFYIYPDGRIYPLEGQKGIKIVIKSDDKSIAIVNKSSYGALNISYD